MPPPEFKLINLLDYYLSDEESHGRSPEVRVQCPEDERRDEVVRRCQPRS